MIIAIAAKAQVPNFGTIAGDQKLYGYSAMKHRANTKTWETYSALQYDVTDYMNVVADLCYNGSDSYIGYIFRTGKKINPYFSDGVQFTPSFNLGENHKLALHDGGFVYERQHKEERSYVWGTQTWLEQANHEVS